MVLKLSGRQRILLTADLDEDPTVKRRGARVNCGMTLNGLVEEGSNVES